MWFANFRAALTDKAPIARPEQVLNARPRPPYARASDVVLVKRLKLLQPPGYYYGVDTLTGAEGAVLLEDMLRTGQCHWRGTGKKHPPLTLGLPRLAKLEWRADEHGMQSPGLDVTPGATTILPLAPPWYLDEGTGSCGPLDTGLPPAVAEAWFNAPILTPNESELLSEELVRRYPEMQVPAPRRIEVETVTNVKPVPCLRLFSQKVSQQNYGYYYGRSRGAETIDLNLARLEFDYEGQRVQAGAAAAVLELFSDGKLRRVTRHQKTEMLAYARLAQCGFGEASEQFFKYRLGKNAGALTLSRMRTRGLISARDAQPELVADGLARGNRREFLFPPGRTGELVTDALEGSGIDWFGVEIGNCSLTVQKLSLLPEFCWNKFSAIRS